MKIPKEKRDRLMELGKSLGMTKITMSVNKAGLITMRGFVKEINGWVTIGGERD